MSGFLGKASSNPGGRLEKQDNRLQPAWFSTQAPHEPEEIRWPRSYTRNAGLQAGNWTTGIQQVWDMSVFVAVDAAMGQRKNIVSGVTRDATNAALAGVTIRIFENVTNTLVTTLTSDASGIYTYVAPEPYNTTGVYAVADLAGSPETAGVTINNVVPT